VVNLGSDPQASSSALISRAPDIATLRIIPLVDFSDWRIVQDYRDKSVLKGFSTVGGLWTFLGGIFAFLFGKSISYIAFSGFFYEYLKKKCWQFLRTTEIKPLSAFGIVDQLCSEELRQRYRAKYGDGFEAAMNMPYNQFMMDHFVDVEIIRREVIQNWMPRPDLVVFNMYLNLAYLLGNVISEYHSADSWSRV